MYYKFNSTHKLRVKKWHTHKKDGFMGKFTRHLKMNYYQSFSNYSKTIEEEETLSNLCYVKSIILRQNRMRTLQQLLQENISDEHRCNNHQQHTSKQNSAVY